MTIPALMNCPHRDDSWCLDCTAKEWEEHRAEVERLRGLVDALLVGLEEIEPAVAEAKAYLAALRGEEGADTSP